MGLPALPYADWSETRTTLHVLCQIVGKVRAALHPKLNHWWHVTLYVTPRGLTTRSIPLAGGGVLEVEIDLYEFNGRPGPAFPAESDPVTREAYSHEVVSFGFWPGDPWTPAPAFYAYVYPEPERLVEAQLVPDAAAWANPRGRGNLALLRYDDLRVEGTDADRQLLAFLDERLRSRSRLRARLGRRPAAHAMGVRRLTPWRRRSRANRPERTQLPG